MGAISNPLGGCGCGCGCSPAPCTLPRGTLHVSLVDPVGPPNWSGSGALTFAQAGTLCTWTSGCIFGGTIAAGTRSWVVTISCDSSTGCYYYRWDWWINGTCTGAPSLTLVYDPNSCSGIASGSTLNLISHTCGAGLNLYFSGSSFNPSNSYQMTITL